MKSFKARGVVIRETEAGESDKRLTLLCKGHGKLNVYARGARKAKSKFLGAAQLFCYGDYVINDGGAFLAMAQAQPIESFYRVRGDYDALRHAHYAAEICEKAVLEDTQADELLLLLLKTLKRLDRAAANNEGVPPRQVSAVFLFRFFKYYGIAPEAGACCACGDEGIGSLRYFGADGALCESCAKKTPRRALMSAAALEALRHILESGLNEAFMFKI
ncbi:MAG: DNA repair protein RecO, partial [Defluviitaleaceae bacterium]|nr:DNA repair protein RecO [Defluviitaleaceae bacterium]